MAEHMEIRKMAELYALYPEAQEGIRYDSPELLMMQYIAENNTDEVMALFREKRQFSDTPPAVDVPYGRFEGKEQIRAFAEGFIAQPFNFFVEQTVCDFRVHPQRKFCGEHAVSDRH